jgi:carbon storage regulator CsrA
MLVLTRKLGEAVRIGDNVEVYVIGVSRGRVKLGFRAPHDVPVQRAEITDRMAVPVGMTEHPVMPLVHDREPVIGAPLSLFRK